MAAETKMLLSGISKREIQNCTSDVNIVTSKLAETTVQTTTDNAVNKQLFMEGAIVALPCLNISSTTPALPFIEPKIYVGTGAKFMCEFCKKNLHVQRQF